MQGVVEKAAILRRRSFSVFDDKTELLGCELIALFKLDWILIASLSLDEEDII
jgi:hypothetical protein